MITEIIAKNLKGLNFRQELGQRTLLVGRNGSGKSARTVAISLAISGAAYGLKQPGAIFDAFSGSLFGDMYVAVVIDGKAEIGRKFLRHGDKTSQSLLVNGQKYGKDDFLRVLVSNGDPYIFDAQSFMACSDNMKMETLFRIFPPAERLDSLDARISDAKGRLDSNRRNALASLKSVESLVGSISGLGYDTDDTGEVERLLSEKSVLEEKIATLEKEEAEKVAAESKAMLERETEAKKREVAARKAAEDAMAAADAEAKRRKAAEESLKMEMGIAATKLKAAEDAMAKADAEAKRRMAESATKLKAAEDAKAALEQNTFRGIGNVVITDISVCDETGRFATTLQKLVAIMDSTGCEECAARIMAKSVMASLRGPDGTKGGLDGGRT